MWLERLMVNQPILVECILDILAPDQALGGRCTGRPAAGVIALPNRCKRQTTLDEFGFKMRRLQ
jgi:hypothetical protein